MSASMRHLRSSGSVHDWNAKGIRCVTQISVECGQHERRRPARPVEGSFSGREMHAVVPAQRESFRMLAGPAYQCFINSNGVQCRPIRIERADLSCMVVFPDSAHPYRTRKGRPDLRMRDEVCAHESGGRYPVPHMLRAVLVQIQLQQSGSIQINNHSPRTQWMSSSLVPAGTLAGDAEPETGCPLPNRSHGWARKRATESPSDASLLGYGPTSRPTGRPCDVTTISSPARARRRYSDRWSLRSRTDTSMAYSPQMWPFSINYSHFLGSIQESMIIDQRWIGSTATDCQLVELEGPYRQTECLSHLGRRDAQGTQSLKGSIE